MNSLIHKNLIRLLAPKRVRLFKKILSRQEWTGEQIKHYQEQKLRKMIKYCWEYVPYYQHKWKTSISAPEDIQTIEDLQQLPLLTKDEVRNELEALTTTADWVKSSSARTGGSTGRPIIFRMTKYDEELAWAQMYTGWHWAGYRIGDPFLVVGGESVGIGTDDKRSRKDVIINRWVTSGSNITAERVKKLTQSDHFNKVTFIYGYPNAIRELGEQLYAIGEKPAALKGIACTAEVMRKEIRARISETFGGVRVLDQYGLNDGALHACEGVEQNGLHLSFHSGILEILDDNNRQITEPDKSGHAIATGIVNMATPFIRYQTGDQLHWSRVDSADAVVKWPKIGPVDGRTGDVIYLSTGRSIAMPGLTLVMRWLDGLSQYQFIQTDKDSVTARLDVDKTFAMTEAEVIAYLEEKIAPEIKWNIVWDKPELTRNEKLLIIKNDWLRAQGLERPQ